MSKKLVTKDKIIYQCTNKHLVPRIKDLTAFIIIIIVGHRLKLQFCLYSDISKNIWNEEQVC